MSLWLIIVLCIVGLFVLGLAALGVYLIMCICYWFKNGGIG